MEKETCDIIKDSKGSVVKTETTVEKIDHLKTNKTVKYELRNIEVLACKHCYSRKTISVSYSRCVLVALGIQNAMRMRHIVLFGLTCCTIFYHIISQKVGFRKKSYKYKTCVLTLSTTFS
jgi:hypothetical protein